MALKITLLILKLINSLTFTKTELTGFIVNGEFSNIEDFPYSAQVVIDCDNGSSACGASILNQVFLLTAAHCVSKCRDKIIIKAYTGSETRFKGFENNVVSYKIHEEYDGYSKANDIALLKLENDLKFGPKVKRVVVMKEPPNYENETALVAGWGWIDSVGTKTKVLKHATQQVYNKTTCTRILKRLPIGTICGRELEGRSYPEKGDSGSALVLRNFIQIGIVSFKKRGYTNDTVVYTDVAYHYNWIKKTAENMYCGNEGKILTRKRKVKKAVKKHWKKIMGKELLKSKCNFW